MPFEDSAICLAKFENDTKATKSKSALGVELYGTVTHTSAYHSATSKINHSTSTHPEENHKILSAPLRRTLIPHPMHKRRHITATHRRRRFKRLRSHRKRYSFGLYFRVKFG